MVTKTHRRQWREWWEGLPQRFMRTWLDQVSFAMQISNIYALDYMLYWIEKESGINVC